MRKKGKITGAFLIGIFVTFGFILFALAIVWFGASKFFSEKLYYVTYFEGSVEGIAKGTQVKYLGVPVGSIQDIRLAPDGRMIEVVMVIEKPLDINDSLRVKIEFAGITGGRFLQLFYTSDPFILSWHPKINFTPPHTYIPSAPSGIETLEAGLKEVLDKIMEIQFKEISRKAVDLVSNVSNFFGNPELMATISNLQQTTEHLKNIMARSDSSSIIKDLETAVSNLNNTTKKLEHFVDSLQYELAKANISNNVNRAFSKVDSLVETGNEVFSKANNQMDLIVFSMNDLVSSLKRTSQLLQKMIREYTERPGQLLFSEPPPKEK